MRGSKLISDSLHNWIPVRLVYHEDQLLCRWTSVKDILFSDPFFDQTIYKCFIAERNAKRSKTMTDVAVMPEWSEHIDSIDPTAFIFHVSRCGSTLVSQALALKESIVSVSEVPLFDELLRLPLSNNSVSTEISDELLRSALRFYGAKRKGEQHFFVKTDSWHLMFYERLRQLYPHVPFIIMYRAPAEVLESNKRKKGIQGLADIVGPEVYGFVQQGESFYHPDEYMKAVLGKFFERIAFIVDNDKNTLLVNYNEGLPAIMERITSFAGVGLTHTERKSITDRGNFDAKNPGVQFVEKNQGMEVGEELNELYRKIELQRSITINL